MDGVPRCPKCRSIMVLRTARKGRWIGRQFWGCPRYPRCHGTRGYRAPLAASAPSGGATASTTPEVVEPLVADLIEPCSPRVRAGVNPKASMSSDESLSSAVAVAIFFVALVGLGFIFPGLWFIAFMGIPTWLAVRNRRRYTYSVSGKAWRRHEVGGPDAIDVMWGTVKMVLGIGAAILVILTLFTS